MPVLVPQNDDGDEAGANGYGTLVGFKAYHDARGNTYIGTDTVLEQALVRAADYADTRFRFKGTKLNATGQTTQWPRDGVVDADGNDVEGIPDALVNAVYEYALRALDAPLFEDAPAPDGGLPLVSISQSVDVISESKTYEGGAGVNGSFSVPAYPAADLIITRAGLVRSGRQLYR